MVKELHWIYLSKDIAYLFDYFDLDHNGYISAAELVNARNERKAIEAFMQLRSRLGRCPMVLDYLRDSDIKCIPDPVLVVVNDFMGYNSWFQGKNLQTLKGHTRDVTCAWLYQVMTEW